MHAALARRQLEAELMDHPALPRRAHETALKGLQRINLVSRTAVRLWPSVARFADTDHGVRPKLLDIASGGGDVAIALALRARRAGLRLEVSGCDVSAAALDFARGRAMRLGVPVDFFHLDALADPLPRRYDFIVTTLFLHHLADADIVTLLRKLAAHCDHLLVSDLVRGPVGYGLAWMGTHLLSSSRIVHVDALRSVRAALSLEEAKSLAASAGLVEARFERHWPQRFLMHWQCPPTRSGSSRA